MVQIKEHAPFSPELETPVLLNPLARTELRDGSYSFPKHLPSTSSNIDSSANASPNNAAIATKLVESATSNVHGVGTDVELISSIPIDNATFLERNFTVAELAYCRNSASGDFRSSVAGRWSAKEAVFKSLKVESKGAGASLIEVEIVASSVGPQVVLHGRAKEVAEQQGVKSFELSISHSDDVVVAVAISSST